MITAITRNSGRDYGRRTVKRRTYVHRGNRDWLHPRRNYFYGHFPNPCSLVTEIYFLEFKNCALLYWVVLNVIVKFESLTEPRLIPPWAGVQNSYVVCCCCCTEWFVCLFVCLNCFIIIYYISKQRVTGFTARVKIGIDISTFCQPTGFLSHSTKNQCLYRSIE